MITKNPLKIIISGGGTGGHVYPAIAIADAIKKIRPDSQIQFVGAIGKMEMEKVPEAGYPIIGLWISGFQRKFTLNNLLFPVKLAHSMWKASQIVKEFAPHVVVGVGGYASAPVMKAAHAKNIPTIIQEQNGYAGVTNKLLAAKADKICIAYPDMERYFPKDKLVFTGNPVRKDITNLTGLIKEALPYFGLNISKKTLLVLGGSLGARTINESIAAGINELLAADIQVIWQTGKFYYEEFSAPYKIGKPEGLHIAPFISRMDYAYAVADVVVSRAGALSISELCITGKPVVLVPSPNVAEDHQTKNAMALVNKEAALMVKDNEARQILIPTISALIRDTTRQKVLQKNILELAKPQAALEIAQEIIAIAEKQA